MLRRSENQAQSIFPLVILELTVILLCALLAIMAIIKQYYILYRNPGTVDSPSSCIYI